MTSTRYFFYILAQAFGFRRKNKHMSAMAEETFLLKEAEAYIGRELWEDIENIEGLSLEYWNLRKLINERTRVVSELDECQQKLNEVHQGKASISDTSNQLFQNLLEERQNALNLLEELAKHRDEIVNRASDIRRAYESIKSKQEILNKENANNPEDFENMTNKLLQLKSEFAVLKSERQEVAEKIATEDIKIDKIDAEITLRKKERRESGSDDYRQIGNINRKISTLRAELVLIDNQMRQIYTEVGKYISRNRLDPKCVKLSKKKHNIIHVMLKLRISINLNRKLAEVK